MADNFLDISRKVPLNMVDMDRDLPEIYNFKHFDEFLSREQATKYQNAPCKPQKWQQNDIIFIQVHASYDPIRVKLIREDGVVFRNFLMDVILPQSVAGDIWLKAQIALDTVPEGLYKVIIEGGDPIQKRLESEPLDIRKEHPETTLWKYSHIVNDDILWENGDYFLIRIDGYPIYNKTISARTTYVDQPQNGKTTRGKSYRQFIYYAGVDRGVMPWQIDLLEDVLNLRNIEIDGHGFTAEVGAGFDIKRFERYEWVQGQCLLRERNNSRVKRFISTGLQDDKITISYIVNVKLFGNPDGSSNDNTATIIKIY